MMLKYESKDFPSFIPKTRLESCSKQRNANRQRERQLFVAYVYIFYLLTFKQVGTDNH